jgi:ribosomal protein S18 acetylase RimI-like enzyme
VVDSSALIAAVSTVPAFRRRGIGTAMTHHALEAAASDGARDAYLDATDAGLGIYTRLGFQQLGRVVYVERSGS